MSSNLEQIRQDLYDRHLVRSDEADGVVVMLTQPQAKFIAGILPPPSAEAQMAPRREREQQLGHRVGQAITLSQIADGTLYTVALSPREINDIQDGIRDTYSRPTAADLHPAAPDDLREAVLEHPGEWSIPKMLEPSIIAQTDPARQEVAKLMEAAAALVPAVTHPSRG